MLWVKILSKVLKVARFVRQRPCLAAFWVFFRQSCPCVLTKLGKVTPTNEQLVESSHSLSKACRNNSWSAWMSCRLGFLAAAIAAEDDWYKPLAFPPEPKAAGWLPPAEPCLCGAIGPYGKRPRRQSYLVWWFGFFFFKKKKRKIKEKERETERKSGPLPLSKQKSSVRSRLGGALPSAHFKSTPRKVRSSVFHTDGATRRRVRAGVGLAVAEVGEQPWNARNELTQPPASWRGLLASPANFLSQLAATPGLAA